MTFSIVAVLSLATRHVECSLPPHEIRRAFGRVWLVSKVLTSSDLRGCFTLCGSIARMSHFPVLDMHAQKA